MNVEYFLLHAINKLKQEFKTKLTMRKHLFLSLLTMLLIFGCKNDQQVEYGKTIAEGFSSYVYAYTSGIVSKAAPVRVQFAQAVATKEQIGEAITNLFTIRPKVNGQAVWEDEQTLRFEPAETLASNTNYTATVDLTQLYDNIPSEFNNFEFDFKTKEQRLKVEVKKLAAATLTDLSRQQLIGTVLTNDIASVEEIEQLLKAQQGNEALEIDWKHDNNQLFHTFTVKNIARTAAASNVKLNWNGDGIGVSKKGSKEVTVPSINDFSLLSAKIYQEDNQYIELNFSDPIKADQNLKGLIQVSNFSGRLRFLIDGNSVRIFPARRLRGSHKVTVNAGIRNINDGKMPKPSVWDLSFQEEPPAVRLAGKGVIMPNSKGLIFPFEAINLTAVEVEIFKIYNNNILQFLQGNRMDGNYRLEQVGKVIFQEKVALKGLKSSDDPTGWNRYALDLSKFIKADTRAIYQVRIGFRPTYSKYYCGDTSDSEDDDNMEVVNTVNDEGDIVSFWGGYYGIEGYYEDYSWRDQDNPCKPAYYNYDRFVRSNVVMSNMGIVAKEGQNKSMFVAVSDLRTTNPIGNTQLTVYDYQQQVIGKGATASDGTANLMVDGKPFAIVAENGSDVGYLKLQDGNALSLSRFNVGGAVTQKGMKGFIYGDRGVWRPGDSLYLNFILENEAGKLPKTYPVTFEFFDARGQLQEKRTIVNRVGNIYDLATATSPDAPTGNWSAKVTAGGAVFYKNIKVETVKPNRLKVDLDFGKEQLSYQDDPIAANLQVNWLYGAPAKNLKTIVEMVVNGTNTTFDDFRDYEFDDPARKLEGTSVVVFEDQVNENGAANFTTSINSSKTAPGRLRAKFKTRAFEKGGDFSSRTQTVTYDPYPTYAGVFIPENKYGEKRLEVEAKENLDFVAVNINGQPQANKQLTVGLYRIGWRWWWDRSYENVSRYNSSQHYDAVEKTTLTTNSKGEAQWNLEVQRWGRYLVRVCDTENGHCSGDFFYAGYPWYDDEGNNREAAAMLAFTSDKEQYQVGETVELSVPATAQGKALITIENGTEVLEKYWESTKAGDNIFRFPTTAAMAPNVYAHITLIQPHGQSDNDLPIRMYGVLPIEVSDPATKIQPLIKMAESLRPKEKFTVEVSESKGQPMAYTIAVVDEGLLDLTNFKTPNPHETFYAREALGVKTWDVYDYVLGAYGGEMERVLSVGGDGEIDPNNNKKQANRFKPVVMHLGPFYLQKGQKASHKLTMPNYIGSVRTMVVAANPNKAYGSAEVTTPVKSPLMVLATLPRVLGPGETLKLPVSVFASEDKIKNATVTITESTGLVRTKGNKSQKVRFAKPGEELIAFDLQVNEQVGVAQFDIKASGNGEMASQTIEIQVRNPNPYITDVQAMVLDAGQQYDFDYQAIGVQGTNKAVLEVSNIPPINLGKRLDYLIQYPHGCIEQTTSSGFPQLFLAQLMELNEAQKADLPQNIAGTIERLKQFQTADGGFAYWPGDEDADAWGSNYAGHFLLEAKAQGYAVPETMLNRWKQFQKRRANSWSRGDTYYNYDLNQSYRLYTLALADAAELGAMNRMREEKSLSNVSKWRLAAAYAVVGKPEVAKQLIESASTEVKPYRQLSYTYGSDTRDQAMIAETMILMNESINAAPLIKDISEALSSDRWHSTQTVAYSLLAVSKFAGQSDKDEQFQFDYTIASNSKTVGSDLPITQVDLPIKGKLNVVNKNDGVLFVRVIQTGQPLIGDQTASSENLLLDIRYTDMEGNALNPSRITQGTDFVAEVKVTNPGTKGMRYDEMALSQVFPSGWEITNSRLDGFSGITSTTPEYQDIRDDRVYTYFDIRQNKTHTYRLQLNAAYQGRFYLPTTVCSAMYDNTIEARLPGQWVEVVAPEGI